MDRLDLVLTAHLRPDLKVAHLILTVDRLVGPDGAPPPGFEGGPPDPDGGPPGFGPVGAPPPGFEGGPPDLVPTVARLALKVDRLDLVPAAPPPGFEGGPPGPTALAPPGFGPGGAPPPGFEGGPPGFWSWRRTSAWL